jgi:hypothetical protein
LLVAYAGKVKTSRPKSTDNHTQSELAETSLESNWRDCFSVLELQLIAMSSTKFKSASRKGHEAIMFLHVRPTVSLRVNPFDDIRLPDAGGEFVLFLKYCSAIFGRHR